MLGTWPAAPCLDCSMPGTLCPSAGFGFLRFPHPTVRSEPGLLRALPFPFRASHELLRARHLAVRFAPRSLRALCFPPRAVRRSLGLQHLALRTVHELLRARHLAFRPESGALRPPMTSRPALSADRSVFSTLRLLPVMDCSTPRSYRSHRSRITSCSTLDASM